MRWVFEMRGGELYARFPDTLSKRRCGEGAAKCANCWAYSKCEQSNFLNAPSPSKRERGGGALIAERHSGKRGVVISEHTPHDVEKIMRGRAGKGIELRGVSGAGNRNARYRARMSIFFPS